MWWLDKILTSKELTYWAALYEIDPWGEQRADLRAGIIAAAVSNKGRKTDFAQPKAFMMYRPPEEEREPTPQEQTALLRGLLRSVAPIKGT